MNLARQVRRLQIEVGEPETSKSSGRTNLMARTVTS